MLLASVSLFIFRESGSPQGDGNLVLSVWLLPVSCSLQGGVLYHFCLYQNPHSSLCWQRNVSTCHLKYADIMDCCKPTLQLGVIGSHCSEAARAGMREVKRSRASGNLAHSLLAQGRNLLLSLRWESRVCCWAVNKQMERVLNLRAAPSDS